jgi:hypothetical protein
MLGKYIVATLFVGFVGSINAQIWRFSEPVRLGGTVNTGAEESIPVFSKDGSMLYFVRTMDAANQGGEMDQDIWFSRKDESGAYTDCARLKDLNNKLNNAVLSMGNGGTRMYLLNAYDGKKDMEKGLAVSSGNGDGWSKPEKIEIPGLDIEGNFYGFHVNDAEDVILVSYAGPGSIGEEDLYVSTKTAGSWSTLTHLGPTVNSAGFEISPFLSKSQDTLFFSSNGFGGQGDADIFYSVKQGSWTSWSAPENLGEKINSPKFDAFFSHTGSQAYWSSNRDGELSDIYMIDILSPPALSSTCLAKDASTNKGSDGSISLTIDGGVAPYTYAWSNGSSDMNVAGLSKGDYSVTITDALGQTATSSCTVGEPAEVVLAYKNFELMHNFAYNKNKLNTSHKELSAFLKGIEDQLAEGRESITINIVSSASQVPTKTFGTNEKLAQTRADNIKAVIEKYFKGNDKVTVEITDVKVQGPAYEEDSANKDRYNPYQFIQLRTK